MKAASSSFEQNKSNIKNQRGAVLFVLERSNVLRAVLQGYTGTAENRFHFSPVFSKAPGTRRRRSHVASSRLRSLTCGSDKMTALDKTKQRAADVNCIRTCPPFTIKAARSPAAERKEEGAAVKTAREQSLGAITLRGDQLTGRFCVLTLMECKQR